MSARDFGGSECDVSSPVELPMRELHDVPRRLEEGLRAFDFDGTLYAGDSTLDFWRFALRRRPGCARVLPVQLAGAGRFALGCIGRDEFKARFYAFLRFVPDVELLLDEFWDVYWRKMSCAVVCRARPGDVVVSASPEFLLHAPCERLGLQLVSSRVDAHSGEMLGTNCRGEEKLRRIREAGFELPFEEFYTDSMSDAPLASVARSAFLVSKAGIVPFPNASEAGSGRRGK